MTVNLSEALRAFVEQKVASGQYASADEVIETALTGLKNAETGELDARWLRAELDVGRLSLELDGGLSPEQVKARMLRVRERFMARDKA